MRLLWFIAKTGNVDGVARIDPAFETGHGGCRASILIFNSSRASEQ